MSSYTFPARRIVGDERPDWAQPDRWAFVAPRPLIGEPGQITPTGWAGEVTVRHDDARVEYALAENLRMDAYLAVWISSDDLVAETRARLVAEYGEDAVAGLDDDEILSCARDLEPVTITTD